MQDILKHLTEWDSGQKTMTSSDRMYNLFDLVFYLIEKGFDKSEIMENGTSICEYLSDSNLPEIMNNAQQLIIAYELKHVADIATREIELSDTSESEINEEKTYNDVIESTEEEIDMDMSELDLKIEEDMSYLDSIKEGTDERK
jgi:hypothetical protein